MTTYRTGMSPVTWNASERERGEGPVPSNWGTVENWANRNRNRWADPAVGGPPAPVVPGQDAGVTQRFERPWDVPPPPALGFATAPTHSHRRKPSIWANLALAGLLLVALAGVALVVTMTTGPTP
jgi:hypothetical protein